MEEEKILELQIRYEEGLVDENFLDEDVKKDLKELYKKQIEEKKENLKIYKEKLLKYLKNKK